MDDLELIARFAPDGGPDEANRQRAEARLAEQIRAARPDVRNGGSARRAHPRRRLVGFSAAGAVLAVAAIVAALLTVGSPGAGGPATVQNAYAAVKQAVADTAAAALSGTISTTIETGGQFRAASTFSWHGEDVQIVVPANKAANFDEQQVRFVGGRYYINFGDGVWHHDAAADGSGDPVQWLADARSDLTGAGLVKVMNAIPDLARTAGTDGSTTYSGLTPGKLLTGTYPASAPLPNVSSPLLKLLDPSSTVNVSLTVGSDGLIRRLHVSFSGSTSSWEYTATYSKLGSTPPIEPPDPSKTVDTMPPVG